MPYPAKLSQGAVVDAGLALLDAAGPAALGMRAVADVLGVRPASLYKHVGDLAGLEALLAERVAAGLSAELDAALAGVPPGADAEATLAAFADAYIAFARRVPSRYALFSATPYAVPADPARPGGERRALWARLLAAVGAVTGDPDDTAAAVSVWAFLHGFAVLERGGLFGASGPRGGLARGVGALARGLARRAGA